MGRKAWRALAELPGGGIASVDQPTGPPVSSRTRSSAQTSLASSRKGDVPHPYNNENPFIMSGSTNPMGASQLAREPYPGSYRQPGSGPSRQPNPPRTYHPYTSRHQADLPIAYSSVPSHSYPNQQGDLHHQPTQPWHSNEETSWTQPGHEHFYPPNARPIQTYAPPSQPRYPYPQGPHESASWAPPTIGGLQNLAGLGGQAGPSSYIPPHLRGQTRSSSQTQHYSTRAQTSANMDDTDASFNSLAESSFDTPHSRTKKARFVVTLPAPEYIALSDPTTQTAESDGKGKTKLLVLDMNGALIYRNRSNNGKMAYPRPYLSSFLEYLFLPEPFDGAESRPLEVFVWSSAQPHNVRGMVESTFGDVFVRGIWDTEGKQEKKTREERGEGRLVGVWARDKMGLNENDYRNKVQTVKDLRILSSHLMSTLPQSTSTSLSDLKFDESNMVLLDDSPRKGVHQPWNQILLSEFDRDVNQASRTAALKADQDGEIVPEGMDDALLCVIGMLEEMRSINNVPAWIRAGGLTPTLDALGNPQTIPKINFPEPKIGNLPTHESFVHWYSIPAVRAYWLQKGKAALRRKGIEIRHGLDLTEQFSPSPAHSRVRTSEAGHSREMGDISGAMSMSSLGDSTNNTDWRKGKSSIRKSRAYSPSRPNEDDISPSTPRSASPDNGSRRPISAPGPSRYVYDADGHPIPPGVTGASKAKPKSQPNRLIPVDSAKWRTFKTHDVASFLLDLSQRGTTPLTDSQRRKLQKAASIIDKFGPDPDDGDDEMEGIEGGGVLGVKRTDRTGEEEVGIIYHRSIHARKEHDMPIFMDEEDIRKLKKHLHPREAARLTKGNAKELEHANSTPTPRSPPRRYFDMPKAQSKSLSHPPLNAIKASVGLQGDSDRGHRLAMVEQAQVVTSVKSLIRTWNDIYHKLDKAVRTKYHNKKTVGACNRVREDHQRLTNLASQIKASGANTRSVRNALTRSQRPLPGMHFLDDGPLAPQQKVQTWVVNESGEKAMEAGAETSLPPTVSRFADANTDGAIDTDAVAIEGTSGNTQRSEAGPSRIQSVSGILSQLALKRNEPEKDTPDEREIFDHPAPPAQSILPALWAGMPETDKLVEANRVLKLSQSMDSLHKVGFRGEPTKKAIGTVCYEAQRQLARSIGCEKDFTEASNNGRAGVLRANIARKAALASRTIPTGNDEMEVEGTEEVRKSWIEQALESGARPDMLEELGSWRETAFLDLLVPKVDLGHLSILILRQIYQDWHNHKPLSHPLHFENTSLSPEYPADFMIIRERYHGKTVPRLFDLVDLAMREAKRWLRLRDRAQAGRRLVGQDTGSSDLEVERLLGSNPTRMGGAQSGPSAARHPVDYRTEQETVASLFNPANNARGGNKADLQNELALSAHTASMALPIVNIPQSSKRRLSMLSTSSDGAGAKEVGRCSIFQRDVTSQKRQRGLGTTSGEGRREDAVGWEWNEEGKGYWPVEANEEDLKIFD